LRRATAAIFANRFTRSPLEIACVSSHLNDWITSL